MLCLVAQSYLTVCDSMDCSPSGSSVHGDSLSKNTGVAAMPSPGDLPNPGIETSSSALQADSLLTEQPGKPFPLIYSVKISECSTGHF